MLKRLRLLLGIDTKITSTPPPVLSPLIIAEKQPVAASKTFQSNNASLNAFWHSISRYSHTDFPFLHQTYSPSSRMPFGDCSKFITNSLRTLDFLSIKSLMNYIIAGNSGVGCSSGWIENEVDEIIKIDFEKFAVFENTTAVLELQALFIIASKIGGGREFWLTDNMGQLFSYALCCYHIEPTDAIDILKKKANSFIKRMRKEAPFWNDIPFFKSTTFTNPATTSSVSSIMQNLPVMARIHLLAISERNASSLLTSTTFKMRSLGVNPLETAPALFNSGLCELVPETADLSNCISKSDIIEKLNVNQIPYKKSWNSTRLFTELKEHCPDCIQGFINDLQIARIPLPYAKDIQTIREYSISLQDILRLLFFA